MNKEKTNDIKLLGTLNNADESGIIGYADQIYDPASKTDVSERISDLQANVSEQIRVEEDIDGYLLAFIDVKNVILGGIRTSGDWYIPRGIPEESQRIMEQIQKTLTQEIETRKSLIDTNDSTYLWAIVDAENNVWLAGLKDGTVIQPKGIPDDVKAILDNNEQRLQAIESFIKLAEASGFLGAFIDANNNRLLSVLKNGNFEVANDILSQQGYSLKVKEAVADTLYHIVDHDGKLLFNIHRNGKITVGNGIVIDGLKSGLSLVDTQGWLFAIVDNNYNVLAGIDERGALFANSIKGIFQAEVIEDYNYILVFRDANGNVLFGITTSGEFVTESVRINGVAQTVDSPEFLYVILDAQKRVIWGIFKSGEVYQPKGVPDEVRFLIKELNKKITTLENQFNQNGEQEINNKALDKVMLYGNSGRAYLGNVALQEPGSTDYCIIMMYGQSLSNGSENPAGFYDSPIDGCYMLGSNVWNTSGTQLQPLTVGGTRRESDDVATGTRQDTIVSTVNTFVNLYRKERPWDKNTKFIACSLGVGGRTVAQLSGMRYSEGKNTVRRYPTCNESNLDTRVKPFFEAVKAIADAEGKTISLSAVFWKQGEADYGQSYIGKTYDEWKAIVDARTATGTNGMSGSKNAYKEGLTYLKEDIFALAKSVFGDAQENRPVFMPYSVCGTYISNAYQTIDDATVEMANEQDDVVQVGPTYVTPDYSGGHLSMNGYRWYGEYCAKALYYVYLKHIDWHPLQPESYDVKDNKIYIYIQPIVPPLMIDKYTPGDTYKNLGFSVRMGTVAQLDANKDINSGGLLQTITDISIVENCIVLTCGNIEKFTGAIEVSYAGQGESGYYGHNQGAGNIRDCDTWQSFYKYRADSSDHGSRSSNWTWSTPTDDELTSLKQWDASYASSTGYSKDDACLYPAIEYPHLVAKVVSNVDTNKSNPAKPVNYHTKDVRGNTIVGKNYPMQNWLLNFYKRIIIA